MIIAFDLFNTVFDFKDVSYFERKAYADHLRLPDWSPLVLPEHWANLPPFPDSKEGIALLRKEHTVITFTNCPLSLQEKLLKNSGIEFDDRFPLEHYKVFKPNPRAYYELRSKYEGKILVVSANAKFGDIEGAKDAGMDSVLIRNGSPADILELARSVGL